MKKILDIFNERGSCGILQRRYLRRDPSGKVSSETRDEVAKEDPDKVLQGIEASIYTHYATYYKNDLQG